MVPVFLIVPPPGPNTLPKTHLTSLQCIKEGCFCDLGLEKGPLHTHNHLLVTLPSMFSTCMPANSCVHRNGSEMVLTFSLVALSLITDILIVAGVLF